MMAKLNYIKGSGFIPGIPARNLTAAEVKQYGGEVSLLATGLYEKPPTKKKSKQAQE